MFNYKDEKQHWSDRMPTLDEYNRAKRDSCKHEHVKDFSCWSFGDERRIPHDYCPDCKCHWFDGKFYTVSQWEAWINMPDFDYDQEAADYIKEQENAR